jgi:endonuclease/exonuclease/phosphatase family metal-dependent hydrolase
MPVYKRNGSVVIPVYNVTGNVKSQLYDKSGKQIDGAIYLTVMSYNYQWSENLNTLAYQQEIYSTYNPDIIGIQEAGSKRQKSWPVTAQLALAGYKYKYLSDYYNYHGLASRIPLEDVIDVPYTTQAGGTYTYQKCYFTLGDKRIAWYNTHLIYEENKTSIRSAQAQELLADAENEEYVIITGDLNMLGLDLDSSEYRGIGKPYADAGYNLANWTNDNFVKTWTDAVSAESLDEFQYATDNIITSENIDIISVVFDAIKLDYLNGLSIDHIPIIARLKII